MTSPVLVLDLSTGTEYVFVGLTPMEAVVVARAYSLGDRNSWMWGKKYAAIVSRSGLTVACGDFTALTEPMRKEAQEDESPNHAHPR